MLEEGQTENRLGVVLSLSELHMYGEKIFLNRIYLSGHIIFGLCKVIIVSSRESNNDPILELWF